MTIGLPFEPKASHGPNGLLSCSMYNSLPQTVCTKNEQQSYKFAQCIDEVLMPYATSTKYEINHRPM